MKTEKGRMVSVAGRWPLKVLEHRTKSTDFASWEKEFLTVFAGSLKPGDIVFDVGAEEGEFSALAAKDGRRLQRPHVRAKAADMEQHQGGMEVKRA